MNPIDWQPTVRTTQTNEVAAWVNLFDEKFTRFSDTPKLDAQVLLAHLLGQSRAWVMAHPECSLPDALIEPIEHMFPRLDAGEPLPYLLGHWEFFGLDFLVSPAALIPRPETELMVEEALRWAATHPSLRILDIGTGSGCIAITLAKQLPGVKVFAGDLSRPALSLARANAARHQVTASVHFLQADLLDPISATFDLMCANLPYIPAGDLASLSVSRFEPRLALDGGEDGLSLIRRLLNDAPRFLSKDGAMLLEIEARQGEAVLSLASATFPEAKIQLHKDLSHIDRLVTIQNISL